MRAVACAVAIAISFTATAEKSQTQPRNIAIERVNTCLQQRNTSNGACKKMKQDVATLVDVYSKGDESVLPTLLRVSLPPNFYGQALLKDPQSFLTTMAQLTQQDQLNLAIRLAGGTIGHLPEQRFEELRAALINVPDSSRAKRAAELCLKRLKTNNALWLVKYFPPQAFSGPASELELAWFSTSLYLLGEPALWPPSASDSAALRFTRLGAFTAPRVATLTLQAGEPAFLAKGLNMDIGSLQFNDAGSVSQGEWEKFSSTLERAKFWTLPTEVTRPDVKGLLRQDGDVWILEAVENGKYHVVVRSFFDRGESAEDAALADVACELSGITGHPIHC